MVEWTLSFDPYDCLEPGEYERLERDRAAYLEGYEEATVCECCGWPDHD